MTSRIRLKTQKASKMILEPSMVMGSPKEQEKKEMIGRGKDYSDLGGEGSVIIVWRRVHETLFL